MSVEAKGIALAVTISLASCGLAEVCPADLRWRVTPMTAYLSVGESLTVSAEALGCGGTEPLEEEMRWSSENSTVVSVNEMTGLITAAAAGSTTIIGEDIGPYRIGSVEIPVTVAP